MGFYDLIVANREIFKLAYAFLIILICFIIVKKSHKMFKKSYYQGIRYFRNAFFFFGLAFFSRYFLKLLIPEAITTPLFEFFFIMAGFFLLYSLLWKRIETSLLGYSSSLFNRYILLFYLMTLVLVIFDFVIGGIYALFFSQILLFLILSIISFVKYYRAEKRPPFLKFYSIAMILLLIAWVLNFSALKFFENVTPFIIDVYILNIFFFLIFLFGVLKLTK